MTTGSAHASNGPDGIEALTALLSSPPEGPAADAYGHMTVALAGFLDALAGAAPDVETADRLRADLAAWTERLVLLETDELSRLWGHLFSPPGHGQTLVPPIRDASYRDGELRGRVTLGRFHVGENMAAHGGALSLLFDDFLGSMLLLTELPVGRTAYLKTDFRAIAPIGVELDIIGRLDRIEGRKRYVTGQLKHGDTVCAEAEGLWVELRPGQA